MKVSVFVGISLDGFIARPDGSFDFLPADGGEPYGYKEFFETVDALVMGRNTYDVVMKMDPFPYGEKPVFVLSTRPVLLPASAITVERLSGSPSEVVSLLSGRNFHHLYVDGGFTVQEFMRAGLIQRITITRIPVIIGAGIPLFGYVQADVKLRLIASRSFDAGIVQSEYEVIS